MNILIVVKNIRQGGVVKAAINYKKCLELIGYNLKFYIIENANKEYIKFYNIKKKDIYNKNYNKKWIPDIGFIISHGITLKNFNSLNNIFLTKWLEVNIFAVPSVYENRLVESFQLSKWMRFLYKLRGGIHKGKILPHAVNLRDFFYQKKDIIRKKYKIPKKSKILLRVGQNSIGKWSSLILKAFKILRLKDSNFFLVLLGAPKELLKSINDLDSNINSKIIILKFNKDYKYLRNLYSEADLFWHIADQGESFGYVLAESLLCKTPVITLQTPWADNTQAEMIGASSGGVVCHTVSDFVNQSINLINSKKRYSRSLFYGEKFIKNNYSINSISLLLKKNINNLEDSTSEIHVPLKEIIKILDFGSYSLRAKLIILYYKIVMIIFKSKFFMFSRLIKKLNYLI
jgi:glycosyltransferase involved in cell wall biosynthesis